MFGVGIFVCCVVERIFDKSTPNVRLPVLLNSVLRVTAETSALASLSVVLVVVISVLVNSESVNAVTSAFVGNGV